MSKYKNWSQERIEEYRKTQRERIRKLRKEKPRDRSKEYEKRKTKEYREKAAIRSKMFYQKHKEKINKKVSSKTKEKRRKLKEECVAYLGGKCFRCCGEFHPHVFDFHHKDPTEKEFNLSLIMKVRYKMNDIIKKELDKCNLVCANCHRMIHAENGY